MADIVENVLAAAADQDAKYKSIAVSKAIDLDIDVGNLLASDSNPLDTKQIKASKEEYLRELGRDNAQLLINSIWRLPIEKVEDVFIAKLPPPTTVLPREKAIPKVKKPTKWQEYAKLKGINKRKKNRMVWDEPSQEFRPRWGYKRTNDDTKDWLIEVPDHVDPYEDQFAKRKKAKVERVAKNELQRLRNIARTQKGKVPGVGLTPTDEPSKDHVGKALALAKLSTASVGKFTERLPKEKPAKNMGKKRKFGSNISDFNAEKVKNLDLLKELTRNRPVLDVTKAVNQHLRDEDLKRKRENEEPEEKKLRAGQKGKKRGAGGSFKGGKNSGSFKGGKGGKGGKGRRKGGKGKGK